MHTRIEQPTTRRQGGLLRPAVVAAVMATALLAALFATVSPSGAVVDGRDAAADEWPWMVSLRSGGHLCGGAIISPTTVATAAHCVEGINAGGLAVRAGTIEVDGRGQRLDVDRIIRHPNYNSRTVENDIALLRLDGSFQYGPGVAPIAVRGSGFASAADAGSPAWATGWGDLDEEGRLGAPRILQEVQLPVVGDAACDRAIGIERDVMLCAGGEGPGTCYGDSGGPLASRGDDGVWYLIGLTSWGVVCGEPGLPGAYAEVGAFTSWIVANTPDLAGGAQPQPQPEPSPGATRTIAENRERTRIPTVGRVDVPVQVAGVDGTIRDLNVRLFGLRHQYASDLTVLLISPSGTRATLFSGIGGDDVLRGSFRIDDEARRSLPLGTRPGRGAYRPTDNATRARPPADLSVFDGEDPNGTWRLRIIDSWDPDSGRLNGVRLIMRTG